MRYRRIYAGFRGIDFANHPINVDLSRSPYSENLWVDKAGVLHKRYPWERILKSEINSNTIHGLFSFHPPLAPGGYQSADILVIAQGSRLGFITGASGSNPVVNWVDDGTAWHLQTTIGSVRNGFQFGDDFYAMSINNIWQISYDDSQDRFRARTMAEVATAPETQIAGFYRAKEVTELDSNQNQTNTVEYEWQWGEVGEKNLFTNRRINTFCGDGEHTVFYLDKRGLRVTKVEIFSPASSSETTQGTVDVMSGTNIRSAPKQEQGNIIATLSAAESFTTYGKNGKWYQIDYHGRIAYVHQDRVTAYHEATQSQTIAALGDWETVTNWTQAEDNDRKCTKITFATAPSAHPRGNGLPNIRVYCVPITDDKAVTNSFPTAAMASSFGNYLIVPGSYLAIAIVKVGIKVANTGNDTTDYQILTPGTDYHIQQINGTEESSFSLPYYQKPNALDEYGWNIKLTTPAAEGSTYKIWTIQETKDEIDTVSRCTTYGKYGEYNNDRIFYTGYYPQQNRDYYSEPGDPKCVLENSYTDIGNSGSAIAGYLNLQSDMLIIKYDDGGSENLFRRTASSDGDITIFPVKAYDGRGAVSSRALANLKGECLYLSPLGLYSFTSSDLGTKYGTQDKSYLLGDVLKNEVLIEAELGVWNDWLLLTFPNGHCYVADTAQQTAPSTTSSHGYEWFYWTGFPARNMILHRENGKDTFYFSTPNTDEVTEEHIVTMALCKVNPDLPKFEDYPDGQSQAPYVFSAQWNTAQDGMEEPAMVKYIETRGAIISLTPNTQTIHMAIVTDGTSVGDARWDDNYNPIDDDVDMIELHAAPDIPYVAINRRIPRFKHVQFIFKNNDPDTDGIGMLNIEFQYRYGRYIK